MECENRDCIYEENWHCLLEEIRVDAVGRCDSCVRIAFPEKTRERLKREQREKTEGYDEGRD